MSGEKASVGWRTSNTWNQHAACIKNARKKISNPNDKQLDTGSGSSSLALLFDYYHRLAQSLDDLKYRFLSTGRGWENPLFQAIHVQLCSVQSA